MKRKILSTVVLILAVALVVAVGSSVIGRMPLKDLKDEEIQSISIHLWPPNETMELTRDQIAELVSLLKQVKIYNRTWMHHASGGQSCIMTITYLDGSTVEVNQLGSISIIDGRGYRSEYEPNEAINQFANKLFNTGF